MKVKSLFASLIFALSSPLMSGPAHAEYERFAMIVAVSDYDILPSRDEPGAKPPYDLAGPKQDALEMVRLARDIGVPDGNLVVLADSIDELQLGVKIRGLPTRRRILDELDRLAARLESGDQVLFFFSGHGSFQPDQATPETGQDEIDGDDETILPMDIGTWNDDGGTVENAITDDVLGRKIDALREPGAFVWVVIDACHSGTALRGGALPSDSDLEIRSVAPSALGVPAALLARAESAGPATRGTASGAASITGSTAKKIDLSGEVTAFYAATASETAVGRRWKRPDGSLTETMGLLTFTIREALAAGRVRTYHDLALRVAASYDVQKKPVPVPAFEGSLHRAIFGHETVAPVRWPIERRRNEWLMDAGVLDGVREASIIQVTKAHEDTGEAVAYARVTDASATSARLEPIAYGGLEASAMGDLSRFDPYVGTVVESGIPFEFRVGRPALGNSPTDAQRAVTAAIDSLVADDRLGSDLGIEWVGPDDAADVYVVAGADRFWLSDSRGPVDPADRAQPPWIPIDADASVDTVAEVLTTRLTEFARARTLLRVMGELELGAARDAVEIELFVDQASQDHEQGLWPETESCVKATSVSLAVPEDAVPLARPGVGTSPSVPLRHCDVVYATVRNLSDRPVDVTPLYFERGFGIGYLGPRNRAHNKIMPGQSRTFPVQINTFDHAEDRPYPVGVEQLVIVVVLQPSDEVRMADYSYLAGASAAPPDRAGETASALDRLLDAAGFGVGAARRGLSVSTGEAAVVRFGLTVTAD